MTAGFIVPLGDDLQARYEGHQAPVHSYIACHSNGCIVSEDDSQLHLWDRETGACLARYPAQDYYLASADGSWLVTGKIEDYGNSQEEYIWVYHIGTKAPVSTPDQAAIVSSTICDGIECWFSGDCQELWTDGELGHSEGHKRRQYKLAVRDGHVSIELIATHEPGKILGEMDGVNSLLPQET